MSKSVVGNQHEEHILLGSSEEEKAKHLLEAPISNEDVAT
jgi:hypothetical protein